MGWNSKPWRNLNGLELQAMAKFKWVGTPSHGEVQMGWNSKPCRNLDGLELQAMSKFKWVAKSKFKWVGTASVDSRSKLPTDLDEQLSTDAARKKIKKGNSFILHQLVQSMH